MHMQRYVSDELTHFVGRPLDREEDRFQLLLRILREGRLRYRQTSSGGVHIRYAARLSDNDMYWPEAVCFCDIPVGDLAIHMRKYSQFGIAFQKQFLIAQGANPVFYIAKNSLVPVPQGPSTLQQGSETTPVRRADYFDSMIEKCHKLIDRAMQETARRREQSAEEAQDFEATKAVKKFLSLEVFSFLKFFDDAKAEEDPENYYMEREWRVVGNLSFQLSDVRRIILPEAYARRLRQHQPDYFGQVTFAE